jgi:Secretion system C-terminal sorting domain
MFLDVNAQVINFPDLHFKNFLLLGNQIYDVNGNAFFLDLNNDGEIQLSEASLVHSVQIQCIDCEEGESINSLEGIEYFTNLRSLQFAYCSIPSLDLTSLIHLEQLQCDGNNISSLNVSGLINLKSMICSENNLTSIDFINDLPLIEDVVFNNNQISSLNINGLQNLKQLYVGGNNITSLNVQNTPELYLLWCHENNISSLEVNHLTNLTSLYCGDNLLSTLDVSQLTELHEFTFSNNPFLETIFMKNGRYQFIDYSIGLDSIRYVCADESELNAIETIFNSNNYQNYHVSTYCSFVPGGKFFVLEGSQKFDNESDGCDENDTIFPNLNYSITNGTVSSNIISNPIGNYFIALQAGTYTIQPILENQAYFTVVPSSYEITFSNQVSPVVQNFCIIPNGIHNDLEITLLPLQPARPGFDTTYKIVYKNKGTTTLSGSVTFEFEDDKMDLVSTIPNFSSQATGLLTYDYLNLQPFETREILITININSPQETPSVNLGDQLDFTAIINPLSGDEHLPDNTSSLKQIVVGSYDPNDKTCVEGNIVGPQMIGQYVHYVIRFENTGTFPAENVVVKDMIDLAKFDLSTLIPISSSHSYVTRIAADGKVEFIFENIQLPFDDANNDGYIAFKIKTLPGLLVGDTFSNKANIYFDYNFPIETNTATTTIQALGNNDFNFEEYLTLYPNPAQNELNIRVKNDILISSISIYNALGQLVLTSTNPTQSIDVSSLKTGNYFVKVISDKGTSNSRFLKE